MEENKEKVLVTGASGYIALHCISELINNGYKVKGSIRDLSKKDEFLSSLRINFGYDDFEICELNLLKDKGWDEAASDCDYILHIASPCVIKEPLNQNEIIEPAVEGTLRALKTSQESSVKKLILTSSIGSMAYGHNKKVINVDDWTNTSSNVGSYIKSKTIAEKMAWKFFKDISNPSFSMNTINPGMVFGPILNGNIKGTSTNLILNIMNGKFSFLPNIYFNVIDVRDVAKLHVQSIKNNQCNNKRIIAASSKSIHFLEISKIIRDLGYKKATSNLIPNYLIDFLGIFNKNMKISSTMINRGSFDVDISETVRIYNWEPIPFYKTMKDMTKSIEEII